MTKFSIEAVENGYILRVIKGDKSPLKELYNQPTYVFNSYDDMIEFIGRELKP